ncbi:MAG: hypothetical protein KatS3mg004_1344 [Bryobacteraceae bacterium]|nr:MAG: hypothetical protein KatS3mg004_1344 [Bryobacteraceae bacterium]
MAETRQAGPRRITTWVSPELGCVELRSLTEFQDAAGRLTDTRELVTVSLTVGEPDADLFVVRLQYQHVSSSEQLVRAARAEGRQPLQAELAALKQQDELGWTHRIQELSTAGKVPHRRLQVRKQSSGDASCLPLPERE